MGGLGADTLDGGLMDDSIYGGDQMDLIYGERGSGLHRRPRQGRHDLGWGRQ